PGALLGGLCRGLAGVLGRAAGILAGFLGLFAGLLGLFLGACLRRGRVSHAGAQHEHQASRDQSLHVNSSLEISLWPVSCRNEAEADLCRGGPSGPPEPPKGAVLCLRKPPSRKRAPTSVREKRRARRLASSCTKRSNTSARASMARVRPSK